ncbi:MAG: hypothetical protein JWO30_2723 [Fibrobacteres bacterium]|nr:hypothetical protein [Fibrobacterota bacterium]
MAAKWRSFRLRRRMHRFANLLIKAREAKPELLSYLERLEMRSENQARELKMLRWTLAGEQMADWDQEQDRIEWLLRLGRVKDAGG